MSVTIRTIVAVALLSAFAHTARATNVGGTILSDTTWTLAGSPYIVTATIVVGGNKTLTIEPGVVVKFNAGLGITLGSQPFGFGGLKAIGTPAQKITFTSNVAPGQPGQWNTILFTSRTINAVYDGGEQYVSGSTLQHCIIEFAGAGTSSSGAVTINEASPYINICEIRQNARCGVYASNTSTSPVAPMLRIKNSSLHHNSNSADSGGAVLEVTSVSFSGNTVSSNTSSGGQGGGGLRWRSYGSNSTHTFTGNVITGNTSIAGGGVRLYSDTTSPTLSFSNNTILNNTSTTSSGGGIQANLYSNNASYTVSGNTISGNRAGSSGTNTGGGMSIDFQAWPSTSLLTLQGNHITGNFGNSGAGVNLFVYRALANLTGNNISNNQARGTGNGDGFGGGLYIYAAGDGQPGVVNLNTNVVVENTADGGLTGGSGFGGGIYIGGNQPSAITLNGDTPPGTFNTIAGNYADVGEAIYNARLYNKNGSNDVPAGYVCWGGVDPNHPDHQNLIFDYFDDQLKSFVVALSPITNPNCTSTPSCAAGLIRDCNNNCAPVSWIGDGHCDNGFYSFQGTPIYFNCPQFGNDGGDCNAPPPPIMNAPNHGQSESQPSNPPVSPPSPQRRHLLLLTHGAGTTASAFTTEWNPILLEAELRAALNQTGDSDAWDIRIEDWTPKTLPWRLSPLGYDPQTALGYAIERGNYLGHTIQWSHYDYVHLIAHSAGSALISKVAEYALASGSPIVHTTYLDAYVGGKVLLNDGTELSLKSYYGLHSHWSDQYYAVDSLPGTNTVLPNSFNADVTLLDPAYAQSDNSSTHTWPRCFYRYSATGNIWSCSPCSSPSVPVCLPYQPYGFGLSYGAFAGSLGQWFSPMTTMYPRGTRVALPINSSTSVAVGEEAIGTEPEYVAAFNPVVDFSQAVYATSPSGISGVNSTGFVASTQPSAAWLNVQVNAAAVFNLIRFEATYNSPASAEGLLTVYVDGEQIGTIDERYAEVGINGRVLSLATDLPSGTHYVSFRLDHFGSVNSNVLVKNVATGFGGFAPPPTCPGDANGDNRANGQDLSVLLSQFQDSVTPGTGADFNSDGIVDGRDLSVFLSNFGSKCP